MSFNDAIKELSRQTSDATTPAAIMFGTVTSAKPIVIVTDNNMTLKDTMLIVPKELREGFSDTHKHKLFPVINGVEQKTGDVKDGTAESHTHTLADEYWTNNNDNTLKEREYYYGLQPGEKVILLRDHGGQRFLVVGRF